MVGINIGDDGAMVRMVGWIVDGFSLKISDVVGIIDVSVNIVGVYDGVGKIDTGLVLG